MRMTQWFVRGFASAVARELKPRLDAIDATLAVLRKGQHTMELDLSALEAAVAADTAVDQSAVTLIGGLSAKIQELIDSQGASGSIDTAKLQALVDTISSNNSTLAAAVAANTLKRSRTPISSPATPPTE